MLSIFNFNKKPSNDFHELGIDIHSHLLPGVDDGVESTEESLRIILELENMGFEKIFTTPHTREVFHPNSLETLERSYLNLKNKVPGYIEFNYSSEYFMDELFFKYLENKQLRPLPGNRLLIEFSLNNLPFQLEKQLFKIILYGYQIVLAHPERYIFFQNDRRILSKLKDMNIEFQLNALSIGGYYGKQVKLTAEKLIVNGWIDFIGTDIHRESQLQELRKIPDSFYYKKLLEQGKIKNKAILA